MKTLTTLLLALCLSVNLFAQKKVGIINFSVTGKDQFESNSDKGIEVSFIGENSVHLTDSLLTSDAIVQFTEAQLKNYFQTELIPVNLNRPETTPEQMGGSLWVMETITEKSAFKKLGYDEAVVISSRIYSSGKSNKGYKPTIEITMKVIGSDGKTIFKKTEKLKLENVFVNSKLIEHKFDDSPISLSDVYKAAKAAKNKDVPEKKVEIEDGQGIPAAQLLDWYKQCFTNLLIMD